MVTRVKLIGNQCVRPGAFYKYQNYYVKGLEQTGAVSLDIIPFYSKWCAHFHKKQIKVAHRIWQLCNKISLCKRSAEADHVGRYLFDVGAESVKVAIDAADGRLVRDKQAYDWCDIYFKANKWEGVDYPAKVMPIVNGNGGLDEVKLNQIKHMRHQEKKVDLNFMAIIYASSNPKVFFNNIEHHTRLFETLSAIKCSKFLKAIVPKNYSVDIMKDYLKRLDRAGVPWSFSWDGMSSQQFWSHLAESRIVFQRPGKHACISWRMIDLLCMGACVVYDLSPFPNWPVPLAADRNYIDCGCGLHRDDSLPPIERYAAIARVIENLLEDNDAMAAVRANNAVYFDRYASPRSVADYVLDSVDRFSKTRRLSVEPAAIRCAA